VTEPTVPNVKPLIAVLWVTIVMAVVVTLIDWKIKNDILKAAADFYQRMGIQVETPPTKEVQSDQAGAPGRFAPPSDGDSVLPIRGVDNVARLEEKIVGPMVAKPPRARKPRTNVQRRATENPPAIPERSEGASDSDEPA